MWEPWIGSGYEKRGLLLLGESCYAWEEGGKLVHPQPDHPTMLAKWVMKNPPTNQPFLAKVCRAICQTEWPTMQQAQDAWQSIAFTNYVPVSVGEGPGVRPSDAAWKQAEEEWPALLDRLKPRVVIVLGFAIWDYMPATDKFVDDKTQAYRLADGSFAMCWATKHPSRGPPWKWYADLIVKAEQKME